MRTSTRLIIFLFVAVGVVMTLGGYLRLEQREAILERSQRNELRAHAITLQIAIEEAFSTGHQTEAHRLIKRLSENPKIYEVLLFNEAAEVILASNPALIEEVATLDEAKQVIETGQYIEFNMEEDLFSMILPVRLAEGEMGAMEITQSMSSVRADFARSRRDIVLITIVLYAAIVIVVLLVTRYLLLRPIHELLIGARAIGTGDLKYRVIAPESKDELAMLAREFNLMANSLAEQRQASIREAEEKLMLERELRQSERLAAVGRLAAGIAHEMGAPLNVIKGRVELLQQKPGMEPERRDRNLVIINSQADAIARIVRQLLTLARPFELNRLTIDLAAMVDEVRELLSPEAEKINITIRSQIHSPVLIDGDHDLLNQVLLNICLNGIQAMPEGGELIINLMPSRVDDKGTEFVSLRIIDRGPGISPEHLSQIFDPFFTTKDIGQGTGLGLTVSRRIIEAHGGWIEVENRPEGGASFTILMPAAKTADRTLGDGNRQKITPPNQIAARD